MHIHEEICHLVQWYCILLLSHNNVLGMPCQCVLVTQSCLTLCNPMGFLTSHVWMWEFDHKEGWTLKNWCIWTMVLEKTLEIPLDWKEIQPVNPKGNQSWVFIGRTDAETESPVLWPPDGKNWLSGKDPDTGGDWRQKEKGTKEDEMVGWHHQLDGHEFERAPGVGDGQRSLACCCPQGCRVRHDWVIELNWISHLLPSVC